MELKLNLQIENLYGGDGIVRVVEEKILKYQTKKSKKTTKSSTGVSSESGTKEENYEVVDKEIQTFKMEKNKPVYRFGGVHGKMWGHLRAAGKMLADLGEEGFDSKAFVDRMMMTINISPVNVVIEDFDKIDVAEIPQITAGISRAMIIQKFDYLPKCRIELKLSFPEMHKERVLKILKQAEELAGMNKRRATIKVLNRKSVFGEGEDASPSYSQVNTSQHNTRQSKPNQNNPISKDL